MEVYPEKHEQLELTANERSFLRTISRAFDEYETGYYVLHINPRRIDMGGGKPEFVQGSVTACRSAIETFFAEQV